MGKLIKTNDITLRQRTEESLIASETRYRRLFESAKDGILILDAETGKIMDVNPFLIGLLGYSKEEFIEKEIWEIGFFKDIVANYDKFIELQQKEYVRYDDLPLETVDGRKISVEFVSNVYLEDKKKVIQCNIRDITKRKQAELALRNNEIHFRTLVQTIPDLIWLKDTEGVYISCNPMFEHFFGAKESDIVGKTDYDFVDRELAAFFRMNDRKAMEAGKPSINEEWVSFADDGRRVFLETIKTPMYDSYGTLLGVLGIGRDITGRYLAEESIKKQKEEFETIFNLVPAQIWYKDAHNNFIRVNHQACIEVGLTNDKIEGHSAEELFPSFAQQYFMDDLEVINARKPKLGITEQFNTVNGEIRWAHSDKIPVFGNDGEVNGLIVLVQDITERKRAEEELKQANSELENLHNNLDEAVFSVDTIHNKMLHVSIAHETVFGYSQEAFFNNPQLWYEIVVSEDKPIIDAGYPVLFSGKNLHHEFRIVHGDGQLRWIEVKMNPTLDMNGKLIRIDGIASNITDRKKLELEKEIDLQAQEALNKILSLSVGNISLEESLERILITIISLPFLSLEKKGGILLTEEGQNILTLKTSYNLSKEIQTMCVQVPFGHCLCGRAAATRTIQFVDCVAEGHENSYEGIKPHGHYNVPILTSDKVLGVIVVYLAENHKQEKYEQDFLLAAAVILSGLLQRKRAEEELKQANSELENLHNNLDEAVFSVDTIHNKMLHVSIAHETVFGYSQAAFFSNPQLWYEIMVPEDKPIVDAGYPVLFSGKNLHHEFRIIHGDGQLRWIEAKIKPTLDTTGKLIRIDGIASNITDRKRKEIELLEKEVQYRNLANSGLALIWTAGTDKLCNYFNEPWLKFTGRSLEQELGNGWAEGIHPDDFDSCLKTYITAFDNHEKFDMEYRLRHVSGEYRWISDLGTPNYNSNGEFIGYIGYCFDITDHKQTEQELIKAKEKAEESDRLKSAFLANMSHEVRTPLNSIIGFSELLADPDFEEESKVEFIQQIIANGNNLLNIISDIMDISKIESHEITIRKSWINVQNFITTIQEQFASQAVAKNLYFGLIIPENDETVVIFADSERLRQIFNNLVGNAIKFTGKGSINISYHLRDKFVEFQIRDTGIGIPAEFHDKIFDRFRQVETATTRKYGGNGLGLAISKNLIELMGGKIWLESKPCKGSVFHFTLPCEDTPNSVG